MGHDKPRATDAQEQRNKKQDADYAAKMEAAARRAQLEKEKAARETKTQQADSDRKSRRGRPKHDVRRSPVPEDAPLERPEHKGKGRPQTEQPGGGRPSAKAPAGERRAKRALEHKDDATQRTEPGRDASRAVKGCSLRVNEGSGLPAKEIYKLLEKSPSIPVELKKGMRLDEKTKSIAFADASTPSGKGREWLDDLLRTGERWEITTGTLLVKLTLDGRFDIAGMKLRADLQDGDERGGIAAIEKGVSHVLIDREFDRRFERPLRVGDIDKLELLLGLTVPTYDMSAKKERTDVAKLHSGRGLIIVATRIAFEHKGKTIGKSIPVPDSLRARTVLHEISVHAGRFTQAKPAAHQKDKQSDVERSASQIDKLFGQECSADMFGLLAEITTRHGATKKKHGVP